MLMAAHGLSLDVVRALPAHDALTRAWALATERREAAERAADERLVAASLTAAAMHQPKLLEQASRERRRTVRRLAARVADAPAPDVADLFARLDAAQADA